MSPNMSKVLVARKGCFDPSDPTYYRHMKACLMKKLGKSVPDVTVLGVDYPAASTS